MKKKYILGIDLGIASIGTALVELDENNTPKDILDFGVRLFDTPEGASVRRLARSARKLINHRKQRVKKLTTLLQNSNILPKDEKSLKKLQNKEVYFLRAYGVKNYYQNIYHLGKVLLHIAKHRGSSFMNEAMDNGEEKDKQKSAKEYRYLESKCKETNLYISEYFCQRLKANRPVRKREGYTDIEYSVPRFLVEKEFEQIWKMQAQKYTFLTSSLKDEISKIIFCDNPKAPYANAKCIFIPSEERIAKKHRLAEYKRIYEELHNIRYTLESKTYPLTPQMRDALAEILLQGDKLTKAGIRKKLQNIDKRIDEINISSDIKEIKAFSHIAIFKETPHFFKLSSEEQDNFIEYLSDPLNETKTHLISDEDLIQYIVNTLQIKSDDKEKIAANICANFNSSRSNLGKTATKLIYEKLSDTTYLDEENTLRVISPYDAITLCNFSTKDAEYEKIKGTLKQLPYYAEILNTEVQNIHPWHLKRATDTEQKFGRIANPVVHVGLNQLRLVVNEIIQLYGKPQKIHIEMSRDLRKSKEERDKITKEIEANQQLHQEAIQELKKCNIPATSSNIRRYFLFKEQKAKDIFSLEEISICQLENYELAHLIPESKGGSANLNNLVLTSRTMNEKMGNMFPYDFIETLAKDCKTAIYDFIKTLPKSKQWRFSPEAKEKFEKDGDKNAKDSRAIDTSYMAKIAVKYLAVLCDVFPVKGGLTAELRHRWGLNALDYDFLELNIPSTIFNQETGEHEPNPEWTSKPRFDHRHHAVDALVIALTSLKDVQQIQQKDQSYADAKRFIPNNPTPLFETGSKLRAIVKERLENIKISRKADHSKAGQLHEATRYGVLSLEKNINGTNLVCYSKKLSALSSKKDVQNIIFETKTINCDLLDRESHIFISTWYEKNTHIKESIEAHYGHAEKELIQEQKEAQQNAYKAREINEKAIVMRAIKLAQNEDKIGSKYISVDNKTITAYNPKTKSAYLGGNNHRLDFYEEKGKVNWEVISTFNANQKDFTPNWQTQDYQSKNGKTKKIWSIWKGDILELSATNKLKEKYKLPNFVNEGKVLVRIVKFSGGKLAFAFLNDARKQGETEYKQLQLIADKGLACLCDFQACRIELTPFGKVHRRFKRLWNGKKQISQQV